LQRKDSEREAGTLEVEETPVREIMHTGFNRVHPDTPIAEVYQSFSRRGCADIVVCDEEGHFQGMITRMDLLRSISPGVGVRSRRKTGCLECIIRSGSMRAGQVMSRSHITVADSATIAAAMVSMEKNRHPDVIVVDENNVAMGIVEMCDILAFFIGKGVL
jgi:CBS domain-containing protein